MAKIGIIGGSGLYKIEGFKTEKQVLISTPFGKPSDKFTVGKLEGREVVFLPRHGSGHRISPSEINYRANIYGMKKLGVDTLISVSACGSLKEELKPMDFVIPDQFLDRTNSGRKMTFFEKGIVAHVSFADPVCSRVCGSVYEAAKKAGVAVHMGGCYVNMEGPAFSTRAESNLYRSWGMDIIGMTNMAEAKLAREAQMCYCTLAAVTDYDCWYLSHESVSVDMIIANLMKNIENAKKIIRNLMSLLPESTGCSCREALKYAIVTDRKYITKETKERLKLIIGKHLDK